MPPGRKSRPESNTYYAQGGIIYKGVDDSPDALAEDILRAGAGHSYPPAVRMLAEEGPPAVEDVLIERVQASSSTATRTARSRCAREGGHTLPRILHVADHTGEAIEVALARALAGAPQHHAADRPHCGRPADARAPCAEPALHLRAARVRGRVPVRPGDRAGEARAWRAKTVLATGGLGQIFLRTTNPVGSRGDGVAMAWNAGARLINMEFVQFHPTTFHKDGAPNFLISEAVRGAGARLVDGDGRAVHAALRAGVEGPGPARHRRAQHPPRDAVARLTHVYLDLRSYIPRDEILSHFPTIAESCLEYGVDITRDLVPVVPAAHYSCGGVWTDEWGRTTLENLYAVGEVSCTGLHGANRLASTSLLEGLVWGRRAAEDIVRCLPRRQRRHPADDIPAWQDTATEAPDPALIQQDMSAIKHIMWNYVGLVRTTAASEPRAERAAPPGSGDPALLPAQQADRRTDRPAPRGAHRAHRGAGRVGEQAEHGRALSGVRRAHARRLFAASCDGYGLTNSSAGSTFNVTATGLPSFDRSSWTRLVNGGC